MWRCRRAGSLLPPLSVFRDRIANVAALKPLGAWILKASRPTGEKIRVVDEDNCLNSDAPFEAAELPKSAFSMNVWDTHEEHRINRKHQSACFPCARPKMDIVVAVFECPAKPRKHIPLAAATVLCGPWGTRLRCATGFQRFFFSGWFGTKGETVSPTAVHVPLLLHQYIFFSATHGATKNCGRMSGEPATPCALARVCISP